MAKERLGFVGVQRSSQDTRVPVWSSVVASSRSWRALTDRFSVERCAVFTTWTGPGGQPRNPRVSGCSRPGTQTLHLHTQQRVAWRHGQPPSPLPPWTPHWAPEAQGRVRRRWRPAPARMRLRISASVLHPLRASHKPNSRATCRDLPTRGRAAGPMAEATGVSTSWPRTQQLGTSTLHSESS